MFYTENNNEYHLYENRGVYSEKNGEFKSHGV